MEAHDTNIGEMGYVKPSRSKNYMLFRKAVRWFVASTMYYSGMVFLSNLFSKRPRARILVYHSISEEPLNPFSVSPEDFEEQVRFLSQEYNVIPLEELVACITDKDREIPPDSVVITFDDGFEDNYIYAYPVLRKYGVPATIFVITERLEPSGAPQFAAKDQTSGLYLSWDQIIEMSRDGVSIGSHTCTHPWLTDVTLEKARREIVESKACLEQQLDEPVCLFAYPGGRMRDFDQNIISIVASSGYSGACIGLNGTNTDGTSPYLLRRTKIEVGDGMYVFKKALKGAVDIFVLLDYTRRFS